MKQEPKPRYPVQDVWLLDLQRPWRPIRQGRAEIRVSKKMSWALLTPATGWPPHLCRATILGKGAFFSLKDAALAKLGRLEAIEKDIYALERFGSWTAAQKVREQLKTYRDGGTIH